MRPYLQKWLYFFLWRLFCVWKQCRPRWNTTLCVIWSGSSLFAKIPILIGKGHSESDLVPFCLQYMPTKYISRRERKQLLWTVGKGLIIFKITLNPLLHTSTFGRLWNVSFLKILWKMEHFLLRSKCSIFHNIFKLVKCKKIFIGKYLQNWIIYRKWCNVLNIAYGVNG